jgi:hypothetical protein
MMDRKALTWRAATAASGALAGFAASNALSRAWRQVTDDDPPGSPADRRVAWAPALVWAVATGVGFGLARLIAQRSAARAWEAATNEPPPGMG